jgi:hypothetical protein
LAEFLQVMGSAKAMGTAQARSERALLAPETRQVSEPVLAVELIPATA